MDINKLPIPQTIKDQIPLVINRFKIDNPLRLAHFLSQCAHESSDFTVTSENLNYSAEGLMKIFPKYFATVSPQGYAKKPEMIANRVYASRMGNGNELSGDGFKYRGRGFIQMTGKNNYAQFDKFVDDDILGNPNLVALKYPLLSAGCWWDANNMNKFAEKETPTQIRKRVNGGTIGLDKTIELFYEYYEILK